MKKWLCLVSMLIICLAICNVSFAATTLKDIKGTKYESAVENLSEILRERFGHVMIWKI